MRQLAIVALVGVVVVCVGLAVAQMPAYGDINPTFNEVYDYYLTRGVEETGAVNVVAQVLADYRAYDTLIETVVLFSAIMAAILVLKTPLARDGDGHHE